MVPRRPREEKENNLDTDSEFYSEDETDEEQELQPGQEEADDVAVEEEFHTDPEDQSSDEDDEDQTAPKKSSYLPAHLLNPSTTINPSATQITIPLEQMNKKQRRRHREKLTQSLRRATRGSGVLEAGEVAQVRRGVVGGRVEKTMGKKRKRARRGRGRDVVRPTVGGKQKLIEGRRAGREGKRVRTS